MQDIENQDVSRELWDYFLRVVRGRIDAKLESRSSLAEQLGVHHSAVARWYNGERGTKSPISISTTLHRLAALGVTMEQILEGISPENAAYLIGFLTRYPEYMPKINKIFTRGGKYVEHLLTTIDLIVDQIDREK